MSADRIVTISLLYVSYVKLDPIGPTSYARYVCVACVLRTAFFAMPPGAHQQYVVDLYRRGLPIGNVGLIVTWPAGSGKSATALAAAGGRRVVYVTADPREVRYKLSGYNEALASEYGEVDLEVYPYRRFIRDVGYDTAFLNDAFLVLPTHVRYAAKLRGLVGRINAVRGLRVFVVAEDKSSESVSVALALCRRAPVDPGRRPMPRCARRDTVERSLLAAGDAFPLAVAGVVVSYVSDEATCYA